MLCVRCFAWVSLVMVSGGYSSLQFRPSHCSSFSYFRAWDLECMDFSRCSKWTQELWLAGSRARAQWLWHRGLVALWHVESSWTRDWAHVSCTGRQILIHCATKEVLPEVFQSQIPSEQSRLHNFAEFWNIFALLWMYYTSQDSVIYRYLEHPPQSYSTGKFPP